MNDTAPTPADHTPEQDDDEIASLEAPLHVKAAAAILALAGTFVAMLGIQILLGGSINATPLRALVAAYLVFGLGSMIAAGYTAQGRTSGAIAGLVMSVLLVGLVWAPFYYGVIAFTMFAGSACSGLSMILLAFSIPACIQITNNRRKFMQI